MARLIASLATLRWEIDRRWPRRDRTSDGWIGNRAHQLTVSDHNPDVHGDVHALDVDADGIPAAAVVKHLVAGQRAGDGRLTYIIFQRVIWSDNTDWKPHRYTGTNPHLSHFHASGEALHPYAENITPWGILDVLTQDVAVPTRPTDHLLGSRQLRRQRPLMTGGDVAYVQRWIGRRRCGPYDGQFGPWTEQGVRWYQGMRGLRVDGVVGPQTWSHIGVRWTG